MKWKTLIVFICTSCAIFFYSSNSVVYGEPYIKKVDSKLPGLTMPPKVRTALQPHPRIYLSDSSLPKLRKKLEHVVYAEDVRKVMHSQNPTDQAFRYLVWGDEAAGQSAKKALLSGKIQKWKGMEKTIDTFQAALMYDWLYLLMSQSERQRARLIVRATLSHNFKKGIQYYWNDMWARGPAFDSVAALALAGDDAWADSHLEKAYTLPREAFSPYRGGAIDVLNSIALNSGGGQQVGSYGPAGSNYEAMFLMGAGLFLTAWQSATNEEILSKTTYFEKFPYYVAQGFLHEKEISRAAKKTLEYITAIGSEESASLAKWLLDKYGRSRIGLVMRLIIGDLTKVVAMSPEQLNLPKAKYLPGFDYVVSRTGWGDADTTVYMSARHWDTARYEPDSGLISIYKGREPLLVRGIKGKKPSSLINNSGIWIWDEKDMPNTLGQGNTFWQSLKKRSRRALSAAVVYDQKNEYYRPETLSNISVTSNEVSATTRYEKLLKYEDVKLAERTFTHYIRENIVLITDHLVVSPDARVAWSLRLAEEPQIDGNEISTSGMIIKLSSPAVKIYWSGGEGRELVGPDGHWHGDGKHGFIEGYSSDKAKAERYGAGYLFAEPLNRSEEYYFEAIILIK